MHERTPRSEAARALAGATGGDRRDSDETALPRLLTRREAAQVLGCSERHIAELGYRGDLPFIRLSAQAIRYSIDDLRDFIARQRQGGPSV